MTYKFILFSLTSFIFYLSWKKKSTYINEYKRFGWTGLGAGFIWGVFNFTITFAELSTSAGNALVIYGSGPIFASVFSYFVLGEHIPYRTMGAIFACFGTTLLIFSSEFGNSSSEGQDISGNVSAMFAALAMGVYFVYMKFIEIKYK